MQGKKSVGFVDKRDLNAPMDPRPYLPAPYDKSDIAAFKALRDGVAEPYQQQLALEWLMQASRAYDMPFHPGSLTPGDDPERLTSFALGMQWIGKQVFKLINMPMDSDEQGEQP
jgi:hypothetical protein